MTCNVYLASSSDAKWSSCASFKISSSFCLIGVSIAISSKISAESNKETPTKILNSRKQNNVQFKNQQMLLLLLLSSKHIPF